MQILAGVFLFLHGLVHLLYAGQSWRFFELRPGMIWPDGSWIFSRLLGNETSRLLASVMLALAALAYLAGGLGLFARQDWWRPVVLGAAALSSITYILFWNGKFQALDDQGGIGLLINLAIVVVVLVFRQPV
ncbi:MAG: hypothetical protein AB1894_04770 [Chloroflexota bacterium]